MDLRATILGFLSWKPLSGYDLKKMLCESEIFYWSGNNNQVYRSLLELNKEGLVSYQVKQHVSLPAKKIYTITDKGLEELYHSLQAQPELPEQRKNFLIQLAWSEPLSDEMIIVLLEKYVCALEDQLNLSRGLAQINLHQPGRSSRETYLWQRIHQNQIETYQTELDWTRQTLLDLRQKNYMTEIEVEQ